MTALMEYGSLAFGVDHHALLRWSKMEAILLRHEIAEIGIPT